MPKWVNIEEAAKHLGKSVSSLRREILNETPLGKLFYKVGGSRRADLEEIDTFIKQ